MARKRPTSTEAAGTGARDTLGKATRQTEPALGLRPNLLQFTLLAVDNAFVGMLVGSERTVVPLLGRESFHVTSLAVLLSFIVSFGLVKGPLNLFAGRLADRWGRRPVLLRWLARGRRSP